MLGLGNVIMGDEGIGVHVVRAVEQGLAERPLARNVECLDGGTGGFTLLEPLQNAARVILIDAAADGNPEGTATRTTPRFSRDYPPPRSPLTTSASKTCWTSSTFRAEARVWCSMPLPSIPASLSA